MRSKNKKLALLGITAISSLAIGVFAVSGIATDAFAYSYNSKNVLENRITLDSTHNPILIGKGGRTLQALGELVKLATSNHFHKRFRMFLDINGYKDIKYNSYNTLLEKETILYIQKLFNVKEDEFLPEPQRDSLD